MAGTTIPPAMEVIMLEVQVLRTVGGIIGIPIVIIDTALTRAEEGINPERYGHFRIT